MNLFDDLTPGEIWRIQDDIRFNRITFNKGDTVILFSKKKNGYPKNLKIGDVGVVRSVEIEHLVIDFSQTHPVASGRKIPKKLLIEKTYLRDLKLKKLLS